MAKDAFISYSSKDHDAAQEIGDMLEKRGIVCWIAPRDVTPGKSYAEEIIDSICATHATILILSENSNESAQVRNEIERAVHYGKTIIPLRIRNVMPSKALELFVGAPHWVDAWIPPLEQKIDQLAAAIKGLKGITPATPHLATLKDDEESLEEIAREYAARFMDLPFAAAAFKEDLRRIVEKLEHEGRGAERDRAAIATLLRLYSAAVIMTPAGNDVTAPIREGLPWLRKALATYAGFAGSTALVKSQQFFAGVLEGQYSSVELEIFIGHQLRVAIVEASEEEIASRTQEAMATIAPMLKRKAGGASIPAGNELKSMPHGDASSGYSASSPGQTEAEENEMKSAVNELTDKQSAALELGLALGSKLSLAALPLGLKENSFAG